MVFEVLFRELFDSFWTSADFGASDNTQTVPNVPL